VVQHWRRVKDGERWGRQWGLQALAAADRLQLSLGAHMDELYGLVQPHAEAFQRACNINEVCNTPPPLPGPVDARTRVVTICGVAI